MIDLRKADPVDVPVALHERYRSLAPGVSTQLRIDWPEGLPVSLDDVLLGASFSLTSSRGDAHHVERLHSLADTVGPAMRLLVCGLNPSVHAADAGVGFVTPSNRFWTAAIGAGLVTEVRDPVGALTNHGIGMTDVVKRATRRADELSAAEYRHGFARLERLASWLMPAAICFVGLAGYRAARDRRATAGWQSRTVGGRPAYVMPSTSGLNAATPLSTLVDHLSAAAAGPTGWVQAP